MKHITYTHTLSLTHTCIQTCVPGGISPFSPQLLDNCEMHSLCTTALPQRKIISVIKLMGLSETGERPREAKEKRVEKKNLKKTSSSVLKEKPRSRSHCFMIRLLKNRRECSFSPGCHDTVADKRRCPHTMGGFEMLVSLIDKAKQLYNARR